MTTCYSRLETHSTFCTYLIKPIEQYMDEPTVKRNITARLTFIAITVASLAETILAHHTAGTH